MKKLLALVLALVMTLGLATVGANAASVKYADASDITYKEAVDVLSEIGILGGDETGFRPTETLKRSEGAKIIAYLALGNKAAETLSGTGAKFADVPANHWAAGYIEYLAAANIIGGVGDNKFDPDGTLTTTAFAKMLLCALGYDQTLEGLVGTDWAINTQKIANSLDLFGGNDNATGSAAITREEAALYGLNTLTSPIVEYDSKGNSITVGDTVIAFGASNATPRTNLATNQTERYTNINNTTVNLTGGNAANIVEFAEEYYPKLVLNGGNGGSATDDFARPANKWVYDGKSIGTYTQKEDLLYTGYVTLGTIYADLGLTGGTPVTIKKGAIVTTTAGATGESLYYVDGVRIDNANGNAAGTANALNIAKESNTKIGGPGTDVYVYYNEGEVRVCETNWYVGDVAGVYAATATKDAYVDIATRGVDTALLTFTAQGSPSGTKKTTSFAQDDVVVYTASWSGGADVATPKSSASIQTVEKATVVSGNLTSYTKLGVDGVDGRRATGKVTVDGTSYDFSNKLSGDPSTALLTTGAKVTVVLDKAGNAIDVDDTGVQNYAVVVKAGTVSSGTYGGTDYAVNLLLTDGTTTGQVSLDSKSYTSGTYRYTNLRDGLGGTHGIALGDIVSFTVDSDGDYTLTLQEPNKGLASQSSDTEIITNSSAALDDAFGVTKANGKTVFLFKDTSGNYRVYNGTANVPTVVARSGKKINHLNAFSDQKVTGTGVATIVYVDYADGEAYIQTGETLFVAVDKAVGVTLDSANGNYYEFGAFVNGTPTRLKVSETQGKALKDEFVLRGGYAMYETVSYNSKDIATLGSRIYPVTGTIARSNNVVGLGGNFYTGADNVKVFYINENNEINPSTIAGIPTNPTTLVWFNTNSAGDLSYVFWMKNATYVIDRSTYAEDAEAERHAARLLAGGAPVVKVPGDLKLTAGTLTEIPVGQTLEVVGTLTIDERKVEKADLTVHGNLVASSIVVGDGNVVVAKGGRVAADSNILIYGVNGTYTTGGHVEVSGEIGTFSNSAQSVVAGTSLIGNAGAVIEFLGKLLIAGKLEIAGGSFTAAGGTTIRADTTYSTNASDEVAVTVSGDGNVNLGELKVESGATITVSDSAALTTASVEAASNVTLTVEVNGAAVDVDLGDTTKGDGAVNAKIDESIADKVDFSETSDTISVELSAATETASVTIREGRSTTASSRVGGQVYSVNNDAIIINVTVNGEPAIKKVSEVKVTNGNRYEASISGNQITTTSVKKDGSSSAATK